MTMYLHFPFVTVPIPINPPPPPAPRRRRPRLGTWRDDARTERTLGNDGMSGKEVAWASTVRSDSIPTNSTE